MSSEEIKVSVCVVTYNQEKYIAECLQSLVDQETDFKFEIIVGEDCSTDNTRKIVEGFASKYFDIIVKNFHNENVGAVKNVISTYKMAKGKYICHVDGDDYALPSKLQKQYDALEANLDCVICSHDMLVVNEKKKNQTFLTHNKKINTIFDLYNDLPFFAHSSKMFENDLDDTFWEELNPEAIDIEIHVQQAIKGNIYHIPEPLGAYRKFSGISNQKGVVSRLMEPGAVRIFEAALLSNDLDKEFIKACYAKIMFRYAYRSAVFGDKKSLQSYIDKSVGLKSISMLQRFFKYISVFPSLVIFICRIKDR